MNAKVPTHPFKNLVKIRAYARQNRFLLVTLKKPLWAFNKPVSLSVVKSR